MSKALILLIGEQPAPNLLPTRHLNPDLAVLVHTDRTERVAVNLKKLIESESCCLLCKVEPYIIPAIRDELNQFFAENLKGYSIIFNLTGGTKPMAIAAFEKAKNLNSPFIYFQTEGNQSLLYCYHFRDGHVALDEKIEIEETIKLKDYLGLYLDHYKIGEPRNDLEDQVGNVLLNAAKIDELLFSLRPNGLEALEIDFVVRCGNQVGIGEVKSKGDKKGIDQLNSVAEQRYLGTYIKKFLISAQPVEINNMNLAKAYRIEIIEVPSYLSDGKLDKNDKKILVKRITNCLGVY